MNMFLTLPQTLKLSPMLAETKLLSFLHLVSVRPYIPAWT